MRPRLVLIATALVVLLPAVAFGSPPARAAFDTPVWTTGDFWVYTLTNGAFGIPGNGRLRYDVEGTEIVAVAGVDYSTYRLKMAINVTSGSITVDIPGGLWVRTSDLAPVKMTMTITFEIPPIGTFTQTTTTTYDPPLAMQWPLTEGDGWTSTSLVTILFEMTGQPPQTVTATLTNTYAVTQGGNVTVPAGTFSTTAIRATGLDGTYIRSYWSPQVGNSVKDDSFSSNDTEQSSQELSSYRYQRPPSGGGGGGGVPALPPLLWVIVGIAVLATVVIVLVARRKRPAAPVQPPMQMQMPPTPPQAPPPPGTP